MRRRSEPHTFEQRLKAEQLRLEHELSGLPMDSGAILSWRASISFRPLPRCMIS